MPLLKRRKDESEDHSESTYRKSGRRGHHKCRKDVLPCNTYNKSVLWKIYVDYAFKWHPLSLRSNWYSSRAADYLLVPKSSGSWKVLCVIHNCLFFFWRLQKFNREGRKQKPMLRLAYQGLLWLWKGLGKILGVCKWLAQNYWTINVNGSISVSLRLWMNGCTVYYSDIEASSGGTWNGRYSAAHAYQVYPASTR